MSQRDDRTLIEDAIRAIDAIESFVAEGGRGAFLTDAKLQSAVMYQLLIVGEACGRVSEQIQAKHPEVPWREAVGLRNRLAHGYFNVDMEIVWGTVEDDLKILRSQLQTVMDDL